MTDKIISKPTYKSIVEKLSQHSPLRYNNESSRYCILCGEWGWSNDEVNHHSTCPYRQAVELMQADDKITVDKLEVELEFDISTHFNGIENGKATYRNECVKHFSDNRFVNLPRKIVYSEEHKLLNVFNHEKDIEGNWLNSCVVFYGVKTMSDLRDLIRLLGGE